MLTPDDIARFYNNVLHKEECYVSKTDIQIAIQNMAEAYKPYNTNWYSQEGGIVANYNDPAHRCAYLHKYAPLHTCLVQDMFHKALEESYVLRDILMSKFDGFNICSLGGGPGTDIIGIISACQEFGLVSYCTQVVDLMHGWKSTFNSIVEELRLGSYGSLSRNLNGDYFYCSYIASNLLQAIDGKVLESIRSADLITMVKFISAATCRDTEDMVKEIFKNMKPGAVVLFIDNAAGGFSEVIFRTAKECKLVTLFGPLNHFQYTKSEFNVWRYGYTSCYETKVTAQMLMKPSQSTYFKDKSQNVSNYKKDEAIKINMPPSLEDSDLSPSTEHSNLLCVTFIIIFMFILCVIIYLCH